MKILEEIQESLKKANIIYVSTSDRNGIPHLAAGERIVVSDEGHVRLDAWFCVETIENLVSNPHIAIAVIEPGTKNGFQLIGKVEEIDDKVMMDGFMPELEAKWAGLSTGYTISVTVSHVLKFTTGAHSDLPISTD